MSKRQDDWDVFIPQLAGALRATVNRSTSHTPNKMMLGREITMPADLMFSSCQPGEERTVNQYLANLIQSLQEAHRIAREKPKQSQKRWKKNYDLRLLEKTYSKGDKVYVLDDTARKEGVKS